MSNPGDEENRSPRQQASIKSLVAVAGISLLVIIVFAFIPRGRDAGSNGTVQPNPVVSPVHPPVHPPQPGGVNPPAPRQPPPPTPPTPGPLPPPESVVVPEPNEESHKVLPECIESVDHLIDEGLALEMRELR